MNGFDIIIENSKISHIYDRRYSDKVDITNGKGLFGAVCYTLRNEDINALPKRNYQPHGQHFAELSAVDTQTLVNAQLGISCTIRQEKKGLKFHWTYNNSAFSKFAAYLPLNFLSQKNGKWENQFLVSSPQFDPETKRLTCLFTRPDGNHLMLAVSTPSAAFRIEYGKNAHFVDGFEIIKNLDQTYGDAPKDTGEIIAYLVPVQSYKQGLAEVSKLLNIPCAHYDLSSAPIGGEFVVNIIGPCDCVLVIDPDGNRISCSGDHKIHIPASEYGFYQITPCYKGMKGIPCTVFAHYDWNTMHRNSIESIPLHKDMTLGTMNDGTPVWLPPHAEYRGNIDSNLCEHTMWAWSQLRFMRHFTVRKDAEDNFKNLFNVMFADNASVYLKRQTLIPLKQTEPRIICPWNTYKSDRIQEAFNGANILLAAWCLYRERRYLESAVDIIDTILQHNLRDGCIFRNLPGNHPEDYTTVTAMIIPVVDLYKELSELDDPRVELFKNYSVQIADFVVSRGFDFPTETMATDEYNKEYEDGSISCSALTVLYVARNVIYKPEYIAYAEAVLNRHDAFCVYTCNAPMFHSSLRWWENLWEGDADGPAICCGHAWTIWRAEAEFWLGLAKKDAKRLLSSYNGFMSNFSKQDKAGNMYAIYQCEPCISGAFSEAKDISRRYAVGFPVKKDTTLSRYVYARGYDTWLRCTAVLKDGIVLNGRIENGVLYSTAPYFSMLYIEILPDLLTISADREIEIFYADSVRCIKGKVTKETDISRMVKPESDGQLVLEEKGK